MALHPAVWLDLRVDAEERFRRGAFVYDYACPGVYRDHGTRIRKHQPAQPTVSLDGGIAGVVADAAIEERCSSYHADVRHACSPSCVAPFASDR
jgi:hypothetical protein